jgi:hypothetical protein
MVGRTRAEVLLLVDKRHFVVARLGMPVVAVAVPMTINGRGAIVVDLVAPASVPLLVGGGSWGAIGA